MNKIYDLLGRLEEVKGKAPAWKARCPSHDDRSPSLSIKLIDDGRILIHCFAGCGAADIMESVGLSLSDLFDGPLGSYLPPVHRRHREPEIVYGNISAIRLAEACRRKDREIEELRKQLEAKTLPNSSGRKDT